MGYLSVARIKKCIHTGRSMYQVTCPGDGLHSLPRRFTALLVPERHGPDRPPFDGQFDQVPEVARTVDIIKVGSVDRGKGRVEILPVGSSMPHGSEGAGETEEEGSRETAREGTDLSRHWIFVSEEELRKAESDEIFLFDLLGYGCLDEASGETEGRLRGYSETGAHGILEVEWKGKTILVPLTDEHVIVDSRRRLLRFKDIRLLDPE